MNWKGIATLVGLALTFLLVANNDSENAQSDYFLTSTFETNDVIRELHSSQISSYGKSVLIDVIDPLFKANQHIHILFQLKNNSLLRRSINYNPDKPRVSFDIDKKEIVKVTITNDEKIDTIQRKARIMQTLITDSPFLTNIMRVFQVILPLSRNLILIGLVFNLLDIFLPYIILCQSFIMFGLFNADEHYLNIFFYNIFNSKLDLMSAIRMGFSPGSDTNTLQPLSQYNLANNMFFNIAGQFIISIIFLAITVSISLLAVCCNSQRFRIAKTKLRPLWNGFFMGVFPRLATFTGFHFRIIQNNEVNAFTASVLGLIFVVFFIQLLVQTKRINSKVQYIEDNKAQIGLVSRINYKKDFQFDCLHYSMLYYPVMNYLRLLVFFVPIGAAYDLYYVSFGGPIISQLFMMMIQVSSPGYSKKRDKFFYPLNNFLLLNIQLCIITVALAQSVTHPQVSQIAEIVLFGIAIVVFSTSFAGICIDTVQQVKHRCCISQQKKDNMDEESTQKFVKKIGNMQTDLDDNVHKQQKINDMDDFQDDDPEDHQSGFQKETYNNNHQLKIKKVRRGKII